MERDIERKLKAEVEKHGGLCWKFLSTVSGVPDRICLLDGGVCVFVELKDKGKKPRKLQQRQIRRSRNKGFPVEVIDSEEGINEFVKKYLEGGGADEVHTT